MIFQALDVSRLEARLVRILDIPSDPLKPPRLEVMTFSLTRPPAYFALSYCWGDDTRKSPIEVNGETIYVTKSLAVALRHSDFQPGAMVWIDAVCVNQYDVNEKAQQLRLMGLIYSKAQATVVWLGNEERDTQYAHSFLKKINLDDVDKLGCMSTDKFSTALGNTRHPNRSLRGLHDLLTRPYWERVWIIQEIAKARIVYVRCGSFCFDLGSVIASAEYVDDLPERTRIIISAIKEFRLQELEAKRGALRMTLLQALIQSRYFLATNSRDKVYAVLSLARDGNDIVPTTTYTEPIEEFFRRLSMAFLQSAHPMEVTILSSRAPLNVRSKTQPLWAVDWSDLTSNIPHWLTSNLSTRFNRILGEREFGAPTFSSNSVRLRGRGQSLGVLDSIGDISVQPATQIPHKERHKSAAVMSWVSFNLSLLIAPENPKSRTASSTELTVALAHIIAHADELNTRSGRKSHMKELSKHLGVLVFKSFPILAWARGYLASLGDSTQLSMSALQVWDDAFTTLNLSPKHGLRFAISGSNIILVPRAARVGDVIYRLDSCYFPMVLRKVAGKSQSRSNYKIISEACIGINSDGHWIAGRNCPWSIRHPSESLELLV